MSLAHDLAVILLMECEPYKSAIVDVKEDKA